MKEKKRPTEKAESWQGEQVYQTGSTHPPKSHGGIIAFLLVLVIFLSGISTALGVMNIQLFRQLQAPEEAEETGSVAFSDSASLDAPRTDTSAAGFSLGFTGQAVPDFWQHYYDLPQGIYVMDVEASAQAAGLLPGDVLVSLNGIPVPNPEQLAAILEASQAGEPMTILVFRSGEELILTFTME